MISMDVGVWIGAILTIAVFSFLYKDNKLFRFAEYTVVGAAAGHTVIMNVRSVINVGINPLVSGQFIYILAFVAGFTLYTRFWKRYAWLMRYGVAVLLGVSTAIAIRTIVQVSILSQISGSMLPLFQAGDISTTFFNIIIIAFTLCATLYFVFSTDLMPRGRIGINITRIGRVALFCALGYYLGFTVMSRYSFIIDRLQYLLFTWLGLK